MTARLSFRRYRVNKGDQPTFGAVLRGLEYLKKHGVEFNTLTVVHRRNPRHPLRVYRFLKEVGSTYMQFIPIVERVAKAPDPHGLVLIGPRYQAEAEVSEWSVEPLQFGKFLCEIFDEWVRRDVARYFVQIFDVALESWLGMPQSLCVFRATCGESMAIEHNGDLYSCDHYVYPETGWGTSGSRHLPPWSTPSNSAASAWISATACRDTAESAKSALRATGNAP